METDRIHQLAAMIQESQSTVFFGGAGVSTESGVPDFRSKNGIYSKHVGAERILTPGYMRSEAKEFWTFYRQYLMPHNVKPNACHLGLAALERAGMLTTVVTQNVDALHQAAGSQRVIELHGNGQRFYCTKCGKRAEFDEVDAMDLIPQCTVCGGMLRPDIVLYEEALDGEAIAQAVQAIAGADLVIIGGTSLTVYPAAGLLYYQKPSGKQVVINRDSTGRDDGADLLIRDPIAEVFQALMPLIGLTV